jgi:Glu-tRNA(Gln) amidotransferase subunit E-like FAD-binding protein
VPEVSGHPNSLVAIVSKHQTVADQFVEIAFQLLSKEQEKSVEELRKKWDLRQISRKELADAIMKMRFEDYRVTRDFWEQLNLSKDERMQSACNLAFEENPKNVDAFVSMIKHLPRTETHNIFKDYNKEMSALLESAANSAQH